MMEDYEVTPAPANVHDSQVDLSIPGELSIGDRGWGYSGAATRGIALNAIKATRGHPLTREERALNGRISSIRAHVEVEHPYAFMRRAFEVDVHFVRAFVTTVPRVRVKAMFMCAAFNLMRALFLLRIRQDS